MKMGKVLRYTVNQLFAHKDFKMMKKKIEKHFLFYIFSDI